jgi:ABC-type multidrug transport system ATPase subunit
MTIKLSDGGKRFNREWIFRKADLDFTSGTAYAITGPNGSGKSTLLQAIGGMLQLSEGTIHFQDDSGNFLETPYQHISFCAPYLDVIEEMTLLEFLQFHQHFKNGIARHTVNDVVQIIGLEEAKQKQIRYYSSGMKQRVKLAQAIFSDTPVLLLDEPCTNLDTTGIQLYHALIETYCKKRLVIVCSNDEVEYRFCTERISILDFKGKPAAVSQ